MSITIFPHLVRRETRLEMVTDDEFHAIENFKIRVEQLNDTKSKGRLVPISKTSVDEHGNVVAYENNLPDTEHILAIAVRFRLLFAQKEPTQFEKIVNIIRRRAVDEWAQNYIENIRYCYLEAMKSDGTSFKLGAIIENQQMISLWFNSEFFHSDLEKKKQLTDINAIIGEQGSLFHLYIAIRRCSADIIRMYVLLHRFQRDHAFIYTPNHHFRKFSKLENSSAKL
jgi:hypothetical protein